MNYSEVLENARKNIGPQCKACPVCNGIACGNTLPGPGSKAPGNGAAIGGLKVITENGWFAARPSGTEDIYKIYAESFKGQDHLELINEEAKKIVLDAIK